MASTINGTSTGNGGLISTGDDSGILNIQTNETTAITVDASQRVGIGTTTTSNATLTVNNTDLTSPLYIGSQSDSSSWGGFFVNGATSSTAGNGIYGKSGASFYYNVATGLNHIWTTNGAEKMRIDSSGNLLVGTTSVNSGKLNVVYTGTYGVYVGGAAGASTQMIFFSGATNTGSISSNGSNTAFNTSSDYRLKENIVPMTGCLAKVQALKPVTYKWKVSGLESQGFIAHELAEVCPEAVTGAKDAVDEHGNPQYQGIDTSFLVATLTAAIQELKAINDTQAETINALTARIVAIESRGTV